MFTSCRTLCSLILLLTVSILEAATFGDIPVNLAMPADNAVRRNAANTGFEVYPTSIVDSGTGGFVFYEENQKKLLALKSTNYTFTGDVNDFMPSNFSYVDAANPGAFTVRLDPNLLDRILTGMGGGYNGRVVRLFNSGNVKKFTLTNEDTASIAANRFQLNANTELGPHTAIVLIYDTLDSRWHPFSRSLSNTGVTAGSYTNSSITVANDGRISAASSGIASAPTTATYITETADATLSAEFALGSLATGLLKNTTTTGIPSIAVAGTDYEAALGNPGTNGFVLSSTTSGTRSWIAPATGLGTVTTTGSPSTGNLTKFSGTTSITNGDLTGDVTTSGTLSTTIANNSVTLGKMATITTDSILGRATATTGNVEVLTALPFAFTGDVTRPVDSNIQTIADSSVTYAKMQNVSANSKLLGSSATGSGSAPSELTLGTNLTMSGSTLNASAASGAPTTATYITETADAGLSSEFALGSLATGILKNTTTTGVPSIATAGTDYTNLSFKTISVSGQSDVVADSASDTLTLVAGTGVTITTNAATDNITINSSAGGTHVIREVPSGTIDSSNVTYTLAFTPISGTEEVFLNGLEQESGSGNDYTISGATITYLSAPTTGDRLLVNYLH